MFHRLLLLLLIQLTASCAVQDHVPAPAPAPAPPDAHSQPDAKQPPAAAVPAVPKVRKPGPIQTRPLNVRADCNFRDETGYNGTMKLTIEQARVQAFVASVNVPRRGNCSFDLKSFRQTRDLPNVELTHLHDRCVVRVWEQGDRVTVAFQQCQKMCSGNAWDGLWPILADRRDGTCA